MSDFEDWLETMINCAFDDLAENKDGYSKGYIDALICVLDYYRTLKDGG